jgi:hypothetical protein
MRAEAMLPRVFTQRMADKLKVFPDPTFFNALYVHEYIIPNRRHKEQKRMISLYGFY